MTVIITKNKENNNNFENCATLDKIVNNFKPWNSSTFRLFVRSTSKYFLIQIWFEFCWHSIVPLFENNREQQKDNENNRSCKNFLIDIIPT